MLMLPCHEMQKHLTKHAKLLMTPDDSWSITLCHAGLPCMAWLNRAWLHSTVKSYRKEPQVGCNTYTNGVQA